MMWSPSEEDAILRFWSRVTITDTCWLWDTAGDTGYGSYWFQGRCWQAHRLVWHLTIGELALGRAGGDNCICHTCDTRLCVRPSHLFLASQTLNIEDMISKGRNRGGCGERNRHAKLSASDVGVVRTAPRFYGSQKALAERFGVTREQIRRVLTGECWA